MYLHNLSPGQQLLHRLPIKESPIQYMSHNYSNQDLCFPSRLALWCLTVQILFGLLLIKCDLILAPSNSDIIIHPLRLVTQL